MSRIQWLSLLLLTFGCIIKQVGHSKTKQDESSLDAVPGSDYFNIHLVLILVQVFASCFAGVYNEYLIKDTEKNSAHIMIQNVFMYIDSIICNILLLVVSSFTTSGKLDSNENNLNNLDKVFSYESLSQLLQVKVVLIILNNAAIGIVTSLFLKSLNSILKAFASALELMFTAVLSWIIFDIPLDFNTILAIFIVSFSTWLYSRNPVHNPPKPTNNEIKPSV